MSINIIKLWCVPVISVLIIISSMILDKSTNVLFMVIAALLLNISVSLDRKYTWLKHIQFIFLGAFHYSSHFNWSVLLYNMMIINLIEHKVRLRDSIPIALMFICQYSLIRLSYVPMTNYNIFVSLFDMITSLVTVLFFHVIIRSESEKRRLKEKNEYLTNYDTLTGFNNYSGYIKKVQQNIELNRAFQFVLFDISNVAAKNFEDILVSFSHTLKEYFPNHLGACRYAGDSFGIMLSATEKIDVLQIFENLGIKVTSSITHFPQEGSNFQQLIHTGEERILEMKQGNRLKRQEEQLRSDKMKMVGELAAGMAHEIRNPLTSIQGFIQLSKKSGYNIEPWYDVIMSEITRVGELTVEFLQFSKPHASHMKVEMMAKCMAKVYSLCESEATSCGHTIEMDALDRDIMLLMDRDKIIQVLINLIRNAFQAMERAGHVHFALSREGEMAVIQVRDNGKGIPMSEIDKIFDPFYTTKEEGTGLGLSLCQKIIEDHNGYISVESEVGSGTVFTVKLPTTAGCS
ncbi:sensor histidine kinase [Paenibacillus glacialis]|uniref:histidine kinase n=1 Tax=Paenibacillus glacialis TaxID=494026 RepID=A0A168N2F1_9BACL|nr:ATP-binding protein [Paenibacillus glacialis]OAB45313.1 histidine kinase [Paenibacillus glacialis]